MFEEWIDIEDILPEEDKEYLLKIEYWRYGSLHHESETIGKVFVSNGNVMLDDENESDEHYAKVTGYRELK